MASSGSSSSALTDTLSPASRRGLRTRSTTGRADPRTTPDNSTRHVPHTSNLSRALVAALVDAGRVRSTVTTVVDHLDAAGLREAFAAVDEGEAVGKVVLRR